MIDKIKNYIENLEDYQMVERVYHKKVTPEMVTHDEICYHINSIIALDIHHSGGIEEFVFFRENSTETIGEELDVDLEDFIDFNAPSMEYRLALSELKSTVQALDSAAGF